MRLEARYRNDNRVLVSVANGQEASTCDLRVIDISSFSKLAHGWVKAESLIAVVVPFAMVEMDNGQYNEEYLADLREGLKILEEEHIDVIIVPLLGGTVADFIASMVHTARRIKDCVSVVGFAIPDEVAGDKDSVDAFIDALVVKHPQYVYFCGTQTQDNRLIPYTLRKTAKIS